eukprot:370530-Rhodomonas_salina.1
MRRPERGDAAPRTRRKEVTQRVDVAPCGGRKERQGEKAPEGRREVMLHEAARRKRLEGG